MGPDKLLNFRVALWSAATPAKSSSCSCWRSVLLVSRRTMPSPWARLRLMPPHGGYGILLGIGQRFLYQRF